jgi:hypothetical protein
VLAGGDLLKVAMAAGSLAELSARLTPVEAAEET